MLPRLTTRLVLVLWLALLGGQAYAATYHVPPGGSINAGLAQMRGGDTLVIAGGTYAECLRDVGPTPIPAGHSWDAPTTIKAAPGETVWLRRATQCGDVSLIELAQNRAQYIAFEGINVNGVEAQYNCVMVAATSQVRFQDMEVKHCNVGIQGPFHASSFVRVFAHHNGYNEQGVETCPHPRLGCHGLYVTGAQNTFDQVETAHNSGIGLTLSCEGCGGQVQGNRITASVSRDNGGFGFMIYAGNHLEDSRVCRNHVGIVAYPATFRGNVVVGNREANLLLYGDGHLLEGNVVDGAAGEPGGAGDRCAGRSGPRPPPVVALPAPRNLRLVVQP